MGAAPIELKKGLKQRHLTMIAMGGVIGAGLFVGSGTVIAGAGPAAFLTYAITGVLIILVMRMLGEMATANPSTGSFADYARNALGGWAGFSVGWLYWYFWVIVIGFEAVAGGKVIQYWIDAPLWLISLILMTLMTLTNLFSVSSFGEFEFWFAGIKVAAIIVFIALGSLFVLGVWPNKSLDFSNLTAHGGFFPLGIGAIFSAIVVVIFSMVGAEVATIAAAESHDPGKAIARATNSVILRIAVFFVGSIFLLAVILPWNSAELAASPYVSAFKLMGIPYADHIMNAVVLTAVLSCLNSGLYTSSRMLFVLAARREAPVALMSVNKAGVPMAAILSSTVVGFLCVIAAAVSPDRVFSFLLNSSGAVILFVYLLIAISQIILRRRTSPEKLTVKMWAFPVLSFVVVAAILAVLAQMAFDEDARTQLLLSLASWAIVVIIFFATKRLRGKAPAEIAAAPGGAGCARRARPGPGQRDGQRRRVARRAAGDRRRPKRGVLRLRSGQPDRHRAGDARRRGVRLAGHHRGRSGPTGPNAGDPARGEPARGRSAGQLQAAPGAGRCGGGVQAGPVGHLHPSRGSVGVAALRRGRPRPGGVRHPDHPRGRPVRPGRCLVACALVGAADDHRDRSRPQRAGRRGGASGVDAGPFDPGRPGRGDGGPDPVAAEPVPAGRRVPGLSGEGSRGSARRGPDARSARTCRSNWSSTTPGRSRPGCSRSLGSATPSWWPSVRPPAACSVRYRWAGWPSASCTAPTSR